VLNYYLEAIVKHLADPMEANKKIVSLATSISLIANLTINCLSHLGGSSLYRFTTRMLGKIY